MFTISHLYKVLAYQWQRKHLCLQSFFFFPISTMERMFPSGCFILFYFFQCDILSNSHFVYVRSKNTHRTCFRKGDLSFDINGCFSVHGVGRSFSIKKDRDSYKTVRNSFPAGALSERDALLLKRCGELGECSWK